jgi:predicted metal-dependent hydrolase
LIGLSPPRAGPGDHRRIVLQGRLIDYRLTRTRRRSIGMEIGLAGLTVRAPRWVPLREIDATLAARASWILQSLERWRSRRRDVLPLEWTPGATILYRGEPLLLDLHPARDKAIATDLFHFRVRHPTPDDGRAVAHFVGGWLKDETLRAFVPEAGSLADRLGLPPPPVKLSRARSEWGSCTRAGVVRLNWRLVHLPPSLARYVVAHEVAHLAEMNHSARFWAHVEALYPRHAAARRALDDWTAVLEA